MEKKFFQSFKIFTKNANMWRNFFFNFVRFLQMSCQIKRYNTLDQFFKRSRRLYNEVNTIMQQNFLTNLLPHWLRVHSLARVACVQCKRPELLRNCVRVKIESQKTFIVMSRKKLIVHYEFIDRLRIFAIWWIKFLMF